MMTDPGEVPKEIKYPDVALFIDCDWYINEPSLKIADDFFAKGLRTASSIPKQLAMYVFER